MLFNVGILYTTEEIRTSSHIGSLGRWGLSSLLHCVLVVFAFHTNKLDRPTDGPAGD